MSVQEAQRHQEELVPAEDLAPYIGQWVALRDGRVVANDPDPARLIDSPDVHRGDVILLVSDDPEGAYLL